LSLPGQAVIRSKALKKIRMTIKVILIFFMLIKLVVLSGYDVDLSALEADFTVFRGEECEIPADFNIHPWMILCTALSDDN
jgi:hypothetical protein